MRRTLDDLKNDFIDHMGEKAERFGFPRISGLLEGLLLMTRGRLSLDEMAERLEVAKASVSTNIRLLERWKVVRRVYNRGDRRNYYEIRGDVAEIETEILTSLVSDELERAGHLMHACSADLERIDADDATEAEEIEFLRARFDELGEYVDAVEHVLGVVTREGKLTPARLRRIDIV
jgi:DNA-binding transcriptional regulator GbsR (MarR family)